MDDKQRDSKAAGYQFFMLVLCIYALGTVAAEAVIKLQPEVLGVLEYSDFAVCMIFLADFFFSLWRTPRRWAYLKAWGWLDLLSSIPTLDVARWGRIARIARVFRVLRGLRATKSVTELLLRRRAENTFLALSLVGLLLIVFCSVAILQFEMGDESNIKTAEDAIWWAIATVTTVGPGNHYPVTPEGRFVGALLKFAGIGLFSTFSGFLAAWFIAADVEAEDSEIVALHKEVTALRESVDRMSVNTETAKKQLQETHP